MRAGAKNTPLLTVGLGKNNSSVEFHSAIYKSTQKTARELQMREMRSKIER